MVGLAASKALMTSMVVLALESLPHQANRMVTGSSAVPTFPAWGLLPHPVRARARAATAPVTPIADFLRPNFIVVPLGFSFRVESCITQKTVSQKLTKGYTGVKKTFTLVRSRIFEGTRGAGIRQPFAAAADRAGGATPPSPGDDSNVEATMTKGDHMAAKHIP